jgi:hypothetical protein
MNAATLAAITQHRNGGLTTQESAAALAADHATATNILTDDLSGFLTGTTLFPAFLAYTSGQLPAQLELFRGAFAQLDYILTHLRGRVQNGQLIGGYVRTTEPAIGAQTTTLLNALVGAGLLTSEERTGFLGLGGGYRYERLTAEEITAAWAEQDAAASQEALAAAVVTAYNTTKHAVDAGEVTTAAEALALFAATLEG